MKLGVLLFIGLDLSLTHGLGTTYHPRFFYFYIFYFRFLQKYIFDLEIYRNILRQRGDRDLAARQPGGRVYPEKKRRQKIADRSLGTGRPAAGRPAPQAARQRGGRP